MSVEEQVLHCFCGKEAEYYADNNASGTLTAYCAECEEHRADKYGCAMIIAQGASCTDGACGCGGRGVIGETYTCFACDVLEAYEDGVVIDGDGMVCRECAKELAR